MLSNIIKIILVPECICDTTGRHKNIWTWLPGYSETDGIVGVDYCRTKDYPCKLKTGEIVSGNRDGYGRRVQCLDCEESKCIVDTNERVRIKCPSKTSGKKNQIVN